MRVLVIEDENALREQLAKTLRRAGYAVDAASDGEEGAYMGSEYPVDVAVLDGTGAEDPPNLYDFADDRLPKAGWNWLLAHNDGSHGIHNPTFVFDLLDASIEALSALAME